MGDGFNWIVLIPLAAAGVRLATPLILAGLGEIFSERSGVLNIGLEGMLVAGTFGAYLGALVTNSPWGGALGGMLAGAFIGLLFAVMSITLRGDQVVLGTGINILALGLSSFFFRAMYRSGIPQTIPSFEKWPVPGLSKIPVLGEVFFNHVPVVYLAYLLAPIVYFVLFRTSWGLKLRSVGEYPRAAETAGINVQSTRYLAVILCGMLAGLGGTYLTVGQLSAFTEGLVSGRGFIALAAVIFGRWNPLGVVLACLLFGTADALQLRLQGSEFNIRYEFLLMLPYVLTLITFVLFVNQSRAPASLGEPYPEKM